MSDWLTESAAAERLEISRDELREMRQSGQGPPYAKKGPMVRYRVTDLDRWVDEQFSDTNPDTSDGWEIVEPGKENKPIDLDNLYEPAVKKAPLVKEPVSHIPNQREPMQLLSQDGVPLGEFPDPRLGIPLDKLAGVDATPPHLLEAAQAGRPVGDGAAPLPKARDTYESLLKDDRLSESEKQQIRSRLAEMGESK